MTVRPREPMIDLVADALEEHGLREAYDARPPYQRNDYLLWVKGAKKDETKRRRVEQMLSELRVGTLYMRMSWTPDED